MSDNVFDTCTGSQPSESTGTLDIPYDYELDASEDVPSLVVEEAGVGRL